MLVLPLTQMSRGGRGLVMRVGLPAHRPCCHWKSCREDRAFQSAKIHVCGDKMGYSYASSLAVLCGTVRFWGGQKR